MLFAHISDVKLNKGIILAATVKYLRSLQQENDKLRKAEQTKLQLEESKKKMETEIQVLNK